MKASLPEKVADFVRNLNPGDTFTASDIGARMGRVSILGLGGNTISGSTCLRALLQMEAEGEVVRQNKNVFLRILKPVEAPPAPPAAAHPAPLPFEASDYRPISVQVLLEISEKLDRVLALLMASK